MKKTIHLTAVTMAITAASIVVLTLPGGNVLAHDDGDGGHGGGHPPYDGPGWDGDSKGDPPIPFTSTGVELLSWLPVPEFGEFNSANDCWGYVSESGREYAILGLSGGTAFVEVTDPAYPEIIDVIPGPNSGWRDMKTYQHYCYVVTEGVGAAIQVIDLSDIDRGNVALVNVVNEAGEVTTTRTHNVHINEETGRLYRCGGGSGTIGLRIYSLENPVAPAFIGEWHERYVHDAQIVNWHEGPYAGREIAFLCSNKASNGGDPALEIIDVTDPQDILPVGYTEYSWPGFSHQGWLSKDRQYVFLNDELGELLHDITTTTRVIDVSDLENPFEATTYTNGNTSIGHNLFVRGDFVFHANYRSGLRVFDVSDPLDAFEVGYFDTWPEDDEPEFNSLWSSYPYLPSGIVLGSDKEKGLFVWSVDEIVPKPGDLTGDGSVGVADMLALIGAWGECAQCFNCPADLTGDCTVGVADLLILIGNWG